MYDRSLFTQNNEIREMTRTHNRGNSGGGKSGKQPPYKYTDDRRQEVIDILFAESAKDDCMQVQSLALACGLNYHSLLEAAKDHPDVGDAYNHAKLRIEDRIIRKSYTKDIDGNFAKFILNAKHGFVERTAQDINATVKVFAISFSTGGVAEPRTNPSDDSSWT
jgi:hypothetical protein